MSVWIIRRTDWAERGEEREGKAGKMKDRKLEWPAPSDGLSQTDKWFICFGFASAALLTSTSLSFHFTTSDYWELFSQESHTEVLKTWDFQKTDYKKQQQTEQISMRVKAAGLLNVLLYNTEGYKENIALYSWHFKYILRGYEEENTKRCNRKWQRFCWLMLTLLTSLHKYLWKHTVASGFTFWDRESKIPQNSFLVRSSSSSEAIPKLPIPDGRQ